MKGAPTIHMNGSDPRRLISDAGEALVHLSKARDYMRQITPHMRDYYVKPGGGEEEFAVAQAAHQWRLQRIEQVMDSLEALRYAILDQIEEKKP